MKRLLVVILLAVLALAGISIYADIGKLGDRLAGFEWWAFFAALGLALGNYAIRFWRWQGYLEYRGITAEKSMSALVFGSGLAMAVTPGKVGELIKSVLLRDRIGVEVARTAPIVVAERLTDLIALLILGLAGAIAYGVATRSVIAGLGLVVVCLIIVANRRLTYAILDKLARLGPLSRIAERLRVAHAEMAELVRPRPLVIATVLGVLAWLCECLGFALIAGAFPGAELNLGWAITIYAATTVAGALSFLPGGLVVTEAAMIVLLVQTQGLDKATASAATILTRLATLWFAVALGSVALATLRRVWPATPKRAPVAADP